MNSVGFETLFLAQHCLLASVVYVAGDRVYQDFGRMLDL